MIFYLFFVGNKKIIAGQRPLLCDNENHFTFLFFCEIKRRQQLKRIYGSPATLSTATQKLSLTYAVNRSWTERLQGVESVNGLFISPEYLEGRNFSATMPKAKNQSCRHYFYFLGVCRRLFDSFF